jgi:MFS family permease
VFTELRSWPARRWVAALVGAGLTALVIGLPTDVIPNPVFGRPVDVTWWSYPVLVVTAVLGGLLLATYVRVDEPGVLPDAQAVVADRSGRAGGVGGLLSFFAVGCPVCNKLVVVALGTVGARRWFEPIQPYLAVASVVLLALAVRARLRNARSCRLPASGGPSTEGGAAPAPAHPVAVIEQ